LGDELFWAKTIATRKNRRKGIAKLFDLRITHHCRRFRHQNVLAQNQVAKRQMKFAQRVFTVAAIDVVIVRICSTKNSTRSTKSLRSYCWVMLWEDRYRSC
jgi:hypothetical protein